jgi:nitrogen fixation regulatory protein
MKHPAPSASGEPACTLPDGVYRQAVEQADLAISITDSHANILYANQTFAAVTGYGRDEIVGKNEAILSNKTTPREVYEALWKQLLAGQPWSGRLLNKRKDGSQYLAEVAITPVVDADGKASHYLGMHRDITEMHRLECRVRNQKQLIESVVDSTPVAIALINDQGHIVVDNQEYKKLHSDLGLGEPMDLLMERALPNWRERLAGDPLDCQFSAREVRVHRPGRSQPRWFSCSALAIVMHDESADGFFGGLDRTGLLLVASDITAQRVEQERARAAALQAMISEVERVTSIRESLSAVLYRLEEPMNVMGSAVSLLQRRDPMSAGVLQEALAASRQHIDTLRQCIPPRGSEAVNGLNVNELLRDVLEISTPRLLAAGIVVDWLPAITLPNIVGRPMQLRVLFKALIDNAIEAMDIRAWNRRELHLSTKALPHGVAIYVGDSGPGVPTADRLQVFEPFYSTKTTGQHLGTGLSRAQQIVAEHGGIIDLLDHAGGGCCVHVELPVDGDPL